MTTTHIKDGWNKKPLEITIGGTGKDDEGNVTTELWINFLDHAPTKRIPQETLTWIGLNELVTLREAINKKLREVAGVRE